MTTPDTARRRRHLSRTLSPGRWNRYRRFLVSALAHGYLIVSVEDFMDRPDLETRRTLILRHDVDQAPRSALRMAHIERRLGARSTFYFRWRTASRRALRRLRAHGFEVGFHYETLTRTSLSVKDDWSDEAALPAARDLLREEVRAFISLYGPIRSASYHGDSRSRAQNRLLLRKQDPREFGLEFDGNAGLRGRTVRYWLTDRSGGGFGDDVDPRELFANGVTPIMCLVHPNNWTAGATLWIDRLVRVPARALAGFARRDPRAPGPAADRPRL